MTHGWVKHAGLAAVTAGLLTAGPSDAQRQARQHTATATAPLTLVPATEAPTAPSRVTVEVEGGERRIRSNSIPGHRTGAFPNPGNPNAMSEQSFDVALPAAPAAPGQAQHYDLGTFGVAVNGVVFEPQAAEWFLGDRAGGWQYDPLGGAIVLGLDANHAHVQPNGAYHYHGLPTGLLEELGVEPDAPSPLIGWAMDGFPIYALYAEIGGAVREVTSSYVLKQGNRPSGGDQPGGAYDGTFLADWVYEPGAGDLDECNGMRVVTADFPDGTYAYFLTAGFPVVPRCFTGTPVQQARAAPGGAPPAGGQPPGGQQGGPRNEHPLQAAADSLGVGVEALERAVGPPPPDTARAARILGIEESVIRRALRENRP